MGFVFRAMARPVQLLCLPALLCAGTGCSSFNYEWRRTTRSETTALPPQGAWEGRWKSDANGHNGRLRCLVSQGASNTIHARFRATYARILTFEYSVPLTLTLEDQRSRIEGAANLGYLAGGRYSYDGFVTSSNFFSTCICKFSFNFISIASTSIYKNINKILYL